MIDADLDHQEMVGQMHLASAALRLPSAIYEINRIASDPSLREFADETTEYWREAALISQCIRLGCCSSGKSLGIRSALGAVVLIRNDFGHGEAPRGAQKVDSPRQERLNELYRCRLFEAQQRLISWALERLVGMK